jgi:hypothetical protein
MNGVIFAHDGDAGYSGSWSTLTTARSFAEQFISAPPTATHRMRYSGGAVGALTVGETLTGGTSSATCVLVARAIENGVAAGSADAGWLWVKDVAGTFVAETLTGQTSSGTVVIYQAPLPIVSYAAPKACLITVETADVRFMLSGVLAGTTALSAMGHLMVNGQSYVIRGAHNIKNFSAINAVNASGSIIKYTLFYKEV